MDDVRVRDELPSIWPSLFLNSKLFFFFLFLLNSISVVDCQPVDQWNWTGDTGGFHPYSWTEPQAIHTSICSSNGNSGEIVNPPLKATGVTLGLLCYAAADTTVNCVSSSSPALHFASAPFTAQIQAAGRERLSPGSAEWNTYSVTFFSRSAERWNMSTWTCLLVQNRFLCRPVKWLRLTIEDAACVHELYGTAFPPWVTKLFVQGCMCMYAFVCVCALRLIVTHFEPLLVLLLVVLVLMRQNLIWKAVGEVRMKM